MDATIALMLIEAVLILLVIAISRAITLIFPSLYGIRSVAVDDSCKDAVNSIPAVSSPSSHIIVAPPATKYDVFLSFSGEDTHYSFSSYLSEALCDANLQTFIDHKLNKGGHTLMLGVIRISSGLWSRKSIDPCNVGFFSSGQRKRRVGKCFGKNRRSSTQVHYRCSEIEF